FGAALPRASSRVVWFEALLISWPGLSTKFPRCPRNQPGALRAVAVARRRSGERVACAREGDGEVGNWDRGVARGGRAAVRGSGRRWLEARPAVPRQCDSAAARRAEWDHGYSLAALPPRPESRVARRRPRGPGIPRLPQIRPCSKPRDVRRRRPPASGAA